LQAKTTRAVAKIINTFFILGYIIN